MDIPFTLNRGGYEIPYFSPGYFWGGLNPRTPLSSKEKARRKVRRQMAEKSRRINRR